MMDLHLFSINRVAGQDNSELPGVLSCTPPKRTGHGRSNDQLVLLLSLSGTAAFTPLQTQELLQQVSNTYYASSGPVTSGVREAVEHLNHVLLNYNLKNSHGGLQVVGALNLIIQHNDVIYVVQSGPTHTFFLGRNGVIDYFDPASAERGIGISKSAPLRFFQCEMQAGEVLVLCPNPPQTWTEANLANSPQLSLDALRRRLLNQAGPDLQVEIIRFVPGKGQILRSRLVEAAPQAAQPSITNTSATPVIPAVDVTPKAPVVEAETSRPTEPEPESGPAVDSRPVPLPVARPQQQPVGKRSVVKPAARPGAPSMKLRAALARGMAQWNAGRGGREQLGINIRRFLARMLPGLDSETTNISPNMMIFIAVAVPLVVVAIATTVYLRVGRAQAYQTAMDTSRYYASLAITESNPSSQETDWKAALVYIQQAESYNITDDSQSLHDQIQAALDSMQGVGRLNFVPAIQGSLPQNVQIAKIVPRDNDLYILDGNAGAVYHLTRQAQSTYQIDTTFNCQPGAIGAITVGKLIDLVALPTNSFPMLPSTTGGGAAVIGIDSKGTLLYCAPNKNPTAMALPVPDIGWGTIHGMSVDQGNLYVLDTNTRRAWRYQGSEYHFTDSPTDFFDSFVPANMENVVDLAVNQDDLFLLHGDGQMSHCIYSPIKDVKETQCDPDPAVYMDTRASGQPVPLTMDNIHFGQMMLTQLPDTALYLLDTKTIAIYKFGLQLNLYHLYYVKINNNYSLPAKSVSAFAVDTAQIVFMAFGNELYYASIQ
ncbi:MAG TPA: hypothetical protein VMC62_08870 [Longilinea sp.]|nr:hypothetical protein [Longilinea sp.]